MEDIDSPRIKPQAAAQAIDDLRWLGLAWDEGPDLGGPRGPYVQTQRVAKYQAALDQLRAAERIYPCTCTRADVAAAASAPHVGQEGPRYPGTCAVRGAGDAETLDRPFCWRFRASDRERVIKDLVAGTCTLNVARDLGDFVVAKVDGTPAYQLAVVVDDQAMEVTEVLRGDDLLPSAFRQLELYEFFNWQPPRFAHVPLVVGPDGRRLAKRHGDTRIARLRESGHSPAALVGWLAHSAGLRPTSAPVTARELLADFSLARLPHAPVVLTAEASAALGL